MIELCYSRPMRDKDKSALREIFQFLHHCCDLHLNQTKFNDLLPLAIDGVLIRLKVALVSHMHDKLGIQLCN